MAGKDRNWRWTIIRLAMLGGDLISLAAGLVLATTARYTGSLDQMNTNGLLVGMALTTLVFPIASTVLRLHQGRYAVGSAEELKSLGAAVGITALAVLTVVALAGSPRLLPLSVPAIAAVLSFVIMIGFRLALRSQREGAVRPRTGQRTLVFGAGIAGEQLVRSMLADPASPYLPVGLLDDDPTKRHLRIRGVRMMGGRERLGAAAAATGAEVVVVALPSAGSELVRDISQRASEADLVVKVLPRVADLLNRRVGIRDVRDIDVADLLGRRQIDTNVTEIAHYLRGKRVLVTGAGGSIGSELCRQIHRFGPGELLMLDRDESALHALELSIFGEARLDLPQAILADIRDAATLESLFAERRPDVVFHAAALKHVNMLEQYPDEGWKTNVLGTRNVLSAATAVGVTHFINVSTDKAADPANVLGHTKRIAEQLTAAYAQRGTGQYLSVRFGNVLGSRGSVLETFAAQIARGGPVTITHPEVTRYFMTIPEAVQLVIQAGAIGRNGEALVLDMGTPVRIRDVATHLINLEGRPIDIEITGLRPGEKLHEDLFGSGEHGSRPIHPMISHVAVPPLSPTDLDRLPRRYVLESNTTADPPDGSLRLGNTAVGDSRSVAS
ncbi:polysaccharide biosynthesis protein [Blastococcus mobilis]|uniref:NDP-sugar epimerase, includes UDP-GlcNAc-inverting 4,6-dehydratase FlaA1 and capsular polysaccharide biosynthesis protein EpsC n=1 Tax=Blastococcus mobilis TaxID=1938746 RepID=A0A238Z2K8_9ACTN|nr:nucleoside-diphosphate sugar epimerase/dehydratase [Blastococcus mobilis]SNR77083.1 NDP-sugar epimerase, includes UDP-GlcNAc-inverting 4,6-dehydratase FlaA1 and capsular polysaccharide biosynthesis protein EpsC [Blastococcus mobilis]